MVELVAADDRDDLDDAERAALHTALADAWEGAGRGETRPARELLAKLRERA